MLIGWRNLDAGVIYCRVLVKKYLGYLFNSVEINMFVCLFVCLFNWSLRAETHLSPDVTSFKQNAQARLKSLYKHAGQLVYGNVKREKQI